uniref:non-specific serine/threonine protein kinase n=1 Tax=Oryza rufipogon TaxID=4529 RepID=A0A0E0QDT7_ORYRU
MAVFSLITCAADLVIFFSVCYIQPPAHFAALSFNYPTFASSHNQYIEIEGNASVASVQLWDAATGEVASFTTRFSFNIIPGNRSKKGDGMTFFLTSYPSRLPEGDAGGQNLGLTNQTVGVSTGENRFVAVEFDTFVNPFDPNATNDHIGIDVNSVVSVTNESLPNFSLIGNMTATVDYNNNSRILSVKLWINGSTTPYTLSSMVDLKRALPENVTIGFSASIGSAYEQHQLTSWYFKSTSSFEQKLAAEVASPPPPSSPSPPPTSRRGGVVAGATVGVVMFVILLFTMVQVLVRRRQSKKRREAQDGSWHGSDDDDGGELIMEIEMGTGPRRFPYHKLVDATKSFAPEEKLGQGGFGAVYRGYLRELGLAVAIKRFAKNSSKQGRKEYKSEIKLIGWCHGRTELLLVYELFPNRSLDVHLHGNGTFLTWPMRINIVHGLGSALLYLHEEWDQCVVHRDIKPSNVMLDESFNAKLGDFGLARLIDHAVGIQTMTHPSGTPGYLDPECVITGKASAESDVYSFGIVLLEVACGRRPISLQDTQNNCLFRLVEWVWDLYGQGAVLKAADERLNNEYDTTSMECVMAVGLCRYPSPYRGPGIVGVISYDIQLMLSNDCIDYY